MNFPLPRPDGYTPTEEESTDIKSALDTASDDLRRTISRDYPLETDEWFAELENGDRPSQDPYDPPDSVNFYARSESGGDDPTYRREMTDAGRGHLLR